MVATETAQRSHVCPACRRKYRRVAPTLACWLRAKPEALTERSLRDAAKRLSCSHEAVRLAAQELGVDTSIAGKKPGFTRLAGPRRPRRRHARPMKSNWWEKLRTDPERYAAYLEKQRRRAKERWRADPAFRKARGESLARWRRKKIRNSHPKDLSKSAPALNGGRAKKRS